MLILVLAVAPVAAQTANDKQTEAGWLALHQGDGNAAATAFHEALRRHPRDPILHFGSGIAAHLLGRDDDAVTDLTRALQLNPKLTAATELLGQIKYQQGDLDVAIQRRTGDVQGVRPVARRGAHRRECARARRTWHRQGAGDRSHFVHGRWEVIEASGTGELAGLRGYAAFAAKPDEHSKTGWSADTALTYWFGP